MQTAKLSELHPLQIDKVVDFLYSSQVTGSQAHKDIKNFITGRAFDSGKFFLVSYEEDKVVATVGAVIAEVPRGEIYITALNFLNGCESEIEASLNQLMIDVGQFENCRIKLGIRDGQAISSDLLKKNGLEKIYSLVKMAFAGELIPEACLSEIRLETISEGNLRSFVNTSNNSFKGTLNAANMDEIDAGKILQEEAAAGLCGLIFHQEILKGSYELKLVEEDGWIEAVGILPEYQGQGLGKLFVQKLIYRLKEAGAQNVFLNVIDANERAFKLYQKMNFKIERKLSDWYEKKL